MSGAFEKALAFVLVWEGGEKVTDDPADPGGLTKWGISQRAYPKLDIAALSREEAARLYYQDYWRAARADKLAPGLGFALFDAAVNLGVGRAVRLLQGALGVQVDGVLGPMTLGAAFRTPQDVVLADLTVQRCRFYLRLKQPRFERGWLRRAVQAAMAASAL